MTDRPEFKDLTRDLDWQRASFLKYCLNVTENKDAVPSPEEVVVEKILGGYFTLAALFYKQFRDDLKTHYENTLDIDQTDVKMKLQEALDKLVEEWYRVYGIIAALRARSASDVSKSLLIQMEPFVDEAMRDVALSRQDFPVILEFGQSYSLRFSNYSDDFAALSIPLWVLESPWEWTILWHELAGEKVRKLKEDNPQFFETLYKCCVDQLQEAERNSAEDTGWSVDWVEELFEDSFSVIHFPIHFLFVFRNLLQRHPDGGKEQRHPPSAIRLAAAMSLHLQQKNIAGLSGDIQDRSSGQWNLWPELKNENRPERFSEFDPRKQLSDPIDVKLIWLATQEILKWHHENRVDQNDSNVVFEKMIANAIISYARGEEYQKILQAVLDDLKNIASKRTEQTPTPANSSYTLLREQLMENNGSLDALLQNVMDEHPRVRVLLDGRGYQELLDLSFSDMDFFNEGETTTFSYKNVTYKVTAKFVDDHPSWFGAKLQAPPNPLIMDAAVLRFNSPLRWYSISAHNINNLPASIKVVA